MNVQRIARALQEKDLVVREVVLDSVAKNNDKVLFGARAFNIQVPRHLRKKTKDYDILSKKPRKTAREIAKTLKRRLEGDIKVEKGSHKGTYRIKINDIPTVDVSQKKGNVKSKKILGVRVKDLSTIKKGTQRLVKNPKAEFRREKDIDTLERIKEVERIFDQF